MSRIDLERFARMDCRNAEIGLFHWGKRRSLRLAVLAVLGFLLLSTLFIGSATAHAELERASPAADALLAAPPQTLELWFTERTSSDPNPPSVRILDQSGSEPE